MGKRVVGPSPPEPNWDRLDFRGINSTRNAWGYLAPDDSAIVSDDGKVFIRVDKDMIEKPKSGKGGACSLAGKSGGGAQAMPVLVEDHQRLVRI